MRNLINKAIKHYEYNNEVESCNNDFIRKYGNFTDKDTLKNYSDIIYKVLNGIPNCTHIKAKNLLFQGDDDCWKYFERTAMFWVYGHSNDEWIDHLKDAYEYALYVEREDLIKKLFNKSLHYLSDKNNLSNKDFEKQKVYPSSQLVQFLIEKWLGENPVKDLILKYGDGYGIYQKIIDNWDDLSKIELSYWDELCDYHLNAIGLQSGEKWENEEFLASGLIPMELINIFKIRNKLGLDIPNITHELFSTPMAKYPKIPTGYNENLDIKFQLIDRTVKTKKKYTLQEIEDYIKSQNKGEIEILE
ncbi:hypothetical protein [Aquimarina longa]|uniref:hypothetical protein n=1 Tax=Aquimarina longa TaxID=1080221 RepID=UPI000785F5A5|nr:hypothetical protein [Aquimarina longa]